jgi:Tfp pilus assembly PilM family ATPase
MIEFLQKMNFRMPGSFGREEGFVALDIGSSSIKMVETQIEKSGYRVVHLGVLPLPSRAIQNNLVFDQASVIDTIHRLIRETAVKSNLVISAVPGRAVIMKKIQMPLQEENELEELELKPIGFPKTRKRQSRLSSPQCHRRRQN